jgi:hypothetical protein
MTMGPGRRGDLAVSYTTPNLGPTLFILFNR